MVLEQALAVTLSAVSNLSPTLVWGLNISTAFRKSAEVAPCEFFDLAIRAATLLTAAVWQKGQILKSDNDNNLKVCSFFQGTARKKTHSHAGIDHRTLCTEASRRLYRGNRCFDMPNIKMYLSHRGFQGTITHSCCCKRHCSTFRIFIFFTCDGQLSGPPYHEVPKL